MTRTDAVLLIGSGSGADALAVDGRPMFHGRLVPEPGALAALKGRAVLAFAGIGDPQKFFDTLTQAGVRVAERRAFDDHHRFTGEEAAQLMTRAEHGELTLLTTEKDHARMRGDPGLAALARRAQVLPVTLVVDEADALRKLVLEKLRH
jgi:tetraacyldisaccharide 4'-kinase